jgi:hypothetical protein
VWFVVLMLIVTLDISGSYWMYKSFTPSAA